MKRGVVVGLFVILMAWSAVAGAHGAGRNSTPSAPQSDSGWSVPPTAAAEKNPLGVNDAVLAGGKKLFGDKCARCHGVRGKGDGPEGDEAHQEDMDLTVAARAGRNPDGVLFYRIWNGRTASKMDPMSKELTKEQVWALVAYVQTLRAKPSETR
jgi:mono/diheme cytochrome c family protein